MKKSYSRQNLPKIEISPNKDDITKQFKTTNVNILLNRVRLDEKQNFKKKIIFLSFLIMVVTLISVIAIIK